ncbi:MAG: type II secretion system F family protein [Ottowia sp.]|nr:type II secretion system F family protein [Ottowia sp.]
MLILFLILTAISASLLIFQLIFQFKQHPQTHPPLSQTQYYIQHKPGKWQGSSLSLKHTLRWKILKQLPFYLDTVALCLDAGMNLQNALKLTVSKAPRGALSDIFNHVLIALRTGQAWSDAWREMADQVNIAEFEQLVTLLIQSEQFGLALSPILHMQAQQCRQRYFAHAEKQALEAPIKMLLPLILFIFPCSFIVLAFPIANQFSVLWQ